MCIASGGACIWRRILKPLDFIVMGLPPQIVQSLVKETSREDVAKLLGGYQDMLYRHDRLPEGHALRVCEQCFRVYMWVQKGDVLLFECVYRNVKEVE